MAAQDSRYARRRAIDFYEADARKWSAPSAGVVVPFSYALQISRSGYTGVFKWMYERCLVAMCPEEESDDEDDALAPHTPRESYPNSGWYFVPAAGRSLGIMQWLCARGWLFPLSYEIVFRELISVASEYGCLSVIQYLNEKCEKREWWENMQLEMAKNATSFGHLNVLRWCYDQGFLQPEVLGSEICVDIVQIAIECRQMKALKFLNDIGLFDAFAVDSTGINAAQFAVTCGYLDALKWVHENGWLETRSESAKTLALLSVASGNQLAALPILVWLHEQRLLDAHLKGADGQNIAHMAAKFGHLSTLQWMHAQHLLDVTEQTSCSNGWTVAHMAARGGYLRVLHWMQEEGLEFAAPSGAGWTLGHCAADSSGIHILSWLHETEAVTEGERTNKGWTLAHVAAAVGHVDTLKWLRSKGLFRWDAVTNAGETYLHLTARNGHEMAFKWLASYGHLKPNARTRAGWNVAYCAAKGGHVNILRIIAESGWLDVEERASNDGSNVAHCAAYWGRQNVLDWLHSLELLDFETVTDDRSTMAHMAAYEGHTSVVKWIAKIKGAESVKTAKNQDGWNLAHIAAYHGHLEILRWMKGEGVLDTKEKSESESWTVADFAAAEDHKVILEWLKSIDE